MKLAGIEPATFRFVAQHLNHCYTAVPTCEDIISLFYLTNIFDHFLPVLRHMCVGCRMSGLSEEWATGYMHFRMNTLPDEWAIW